MTWNDILPYLLPALLLIGAGIRWLYNRSADRRKLEAAADKEQMEVALLPVSAYSQLTKDLEEQRLRLTNEVEALQQKWQATQGELNELRDKWQQTQSELAVLRQELARERNLRETAEGEVDRLRQRVKQLEGIIRAQGIDVPDGEL